MSPAASHGEETHDGYANSNPADHHHLNILVKFCAEVEPSDWYLDDPDGNEIEVIGPA